MICRRSLPCYMRSAERRGYLYQPLNRSNNNTDDGDISDTSYPSKGSRSRTKSLSNDSTFVDCSEMNQSEDTFKSTNQEVEHNISNNTDRQLHLRNNVHKSCLNFELSSWNSLKLKVRSFRFKKILKSSIKTI